MREMTTEATWQLTDVAADLEELEGSSDDGLALLELEVDAADRALLEEAMQLTKTDDPREVLRTALKELVERQRFLSWVAKHDPREHGGTA